MVKGRRPTKTRQAVAHGNPSYRRCQMCRQLRGSASGFYYWLTALHDNDTPPYSQGLPVRGLGEQNRLPNMWGVAAPLFPKGVEEEGTPTQEGCGSGSGAASDRPENESSSAVRISHGQGGMACHSSKRSTSSIQFMPPSGGAYDDPIHHRSTSKYESIIVG